MQLQKITITLVFALGLVGIWINQSRTFTDQPIPVNSEKVASPSRVVSSSNTEPLSKIELAYRNEQSDIQVTGSGKVVAVLADDNEGSRHQKFILATSINHTVLVAHNIDLSPRIESLRKDDTVEFYGEYEWNKKGGVVHWTHRDPRGKHPNGWLKHNGQLYQ